MKWIRDNLWWIGLIAAAIAAVFGYRFMASRMAHLALFTPTRNQVKWSRVPGDDSLILVRGEEGPTFVRLPVGVRSQEVASASITQRGEYEVEIRHEPTDRRDPDGDGNALGRLGHR